MSFRFTLAASFCIASLALTACDRPGGALGGGAEEEMDEEYESPEEARYAKAAQPFADAIRRQDYDAAYGMLSAHARARFTLDAFKAAHEQARVDFFTPASADPVYILETDPDLLAGRPKPDTDATEQAMDRMIMQRDLGEVPADISADLRRASVTAPFYDTATADDEEARGCFLSYLLVEEGGQLKVAHWNYRWYDMLD